MPTFSEEQEEQRNRIAAELLAQLALAADVKPHSPASTPGWDVTPAATSTPTFEFGPNDMPAGALPSFSSPAQTPGLFDPGGGSLVAPTPTGRDAFDNAPVADWGGAVFGSPAPTMSSPTPSFGTPASPFGGVYDDSAITTPEDNAISNMPEFNPDQGLPSAPGEQDASLGNALGALGLGDLGALGMGDLGSDNSGDNSGSEGADGGSVG